MPEETEVFDVSDITERAVKTAIEAGFVAVPVALFAAPGADYRALAVAFAFAAGTAAASVVLNAVQQWARSRSSHVQL
jgi:hypothetical protein